MGRTRLKGGAVAHDPLTPPHARREDAEAAFAAVRQDRPDAYLGWGEAMFHPGKADDMKRREAFIAAMVGDPA